MDRTWRKTMAANIRKLTPEQAREIIAVHSTQYVGLRGKGPLQDPTLRALTGGYLSQSIGFIVLRALGKKAGMCI